MAVQVDERQSNRVWGGAKHALAIRTMVILVWLIIVTTTPYQTFGHLPAEFFEPKGVGHILRWSHSVWLALTTTVGLTVLKWSAVACGLVALLSPRASRVALPAFCTLVVCLDAIVKAAAGFPNHAQLAPLLILLVVSIAADPTDPSGSAIATGPQSNVVWLSSCCLVIPYTFIGVNRLVVGGLSYFQGDALFTYLSGVSRGLSTYPFQFSPVHVMPVLNVGFALMTLLEASALSLLLLPAVRKWWLVAMTLCQVMIVFLMNISFWENIVLLWTVFSPVWTRPQDNAAAGPLPGASELR